MSSSRIHLRFPGGILCSSTLCLDSVDAPLPCAPEVMLESSPVWNGNERVWFLGSTTMTTKCSLQEQMLNKNELNKQTNQTAIFNPKTLENNSLVSDSPHILQVKESWVVPGNEVKKTQTPNLPNIGQSLKKKPIPIFK